jgi:hypothetical protein
MKERCVSTLQLKNRIKTKAPPPPPELLLSSAPYQRIPGFAFRNSLRNSFAGFVNGVVGLSYSHRCM